ncbi:MAG: hypothetical protein IJ593_06390 [Lachnospiraceae bacterium]|nr:hypothetical protein [Lachnospiraceae bacterium]
MGYDPQTSGGLLCSIDKDDADIAIKELEKLEVKSAVIGEIVEKSDKAIYLV